MADTADQSSSEQGKFGRALAAIGAFLESLDDTSFGCTLDRIERLEREVRRLKDQIGGSDRSKPGPHSLSGRRR